jgi:hypothetical protein
VLLDIASAVQLAREVEEGVQAVLHGKIPGSELNLQVLLAAGLQLPGYLRRIANQHQESPLDVLALVNELRECGVEPVTLPDPVCDTGEAERGAGPDAAGSPGSTALDDLGATGAAVEAIGQRFECGARALVRRLRAMPYWQGAARGGAGSAASHECADRALATAKSEGAVLPQPERI